MALASVRPTPVGTMTHAETVWSPRIATRADGRRFTWSAGASSCEREAKAVVRRRQRGRFEKRRRDRGRNGGSGELGRKGGEEGGAERDGGSATRARDGPVEDLGALPPCCGGGEVEESSGAGRRLPALALEAPGALFLPLPAHLRVRLLPRIGLVPTTAEAQHEVKRRLLLDVVVRKGAAVLQLLARKDEALLIRGDALLVLDLGLDVVDGVRRLHLKGDRLALRTQGHKLCSVDARREGACTAGAADTANPAGVRWTRGTRTVRVLTKICMAAHQGLATTRPFAGAT